MSRWDEKIKLIALSDPAEPYDSNGFENPKVETVVEVYADKLSVGFSEFFKADMAGYKAELKYQIYAHEYNDEEIVEAKGVRYKVLRTYLVGNGEFIELTLTDMPAPQIAPETEA